ncbi:MAG: ribonuclease H family protein [Alloprevotella sp.]|nr:ribonuclease H family protein [Alloprevotella sp.]
MAKQKYYVVWSGREPGIYTSWETCEQQVKGCEGAAYKSFATKEEACRAFMDDAPERFQAAEKSERAEAAIIDGVHNPPDWRTDTVLRLPPAVCAEAIAVDAACSGNPGRMEYRGVDLRTGAELFRVGPLFGTNNIGEFLAIVHALAMLAKQGDTTTTIYSDSRNAMLWIKQKQCKTKLVENAQSAKVFDMVRRAERWLRQSAWSNPLLKWETSKWGEIPADFGRKG